MSRRMQLVALGDSVTVGEGFSGVRQETRYVARLQHLLDAAELEVDLVPSALEGIDTGYALKRFARMVTVHDPDLVLVMLGLNDAFPAGNRPAVGPEQYQQNLLGLVDRILSLDARPVLVAPNPRLAGQVADQAWTLAEDILAPYVQALREVAENYQLGWVNVYARFAEFAALERLIPDGVHPNAVGHELIADELARNLAGLLGGKVSSEFNFSHNENQGEKISHYDAS